MFASNELEWFSPVYAVVMMPFMHNFDRQRQVERDGHAGRGSWYKFKVII